MNRKMAVIQPKLGINGQTIVVCSVIESINKFGIIPDVYGFFSLEKEKIIEHFGRPIEYNWVQFGNQKLFKFGTYTSILLNLFFRTQIHRYVLSFNSSNHLIFLPLNKSCIHYIHFPAHVWLSMFKNDNMINALYKRPIDYLYSRIYLSKESQIFTNSHFTKEALVKNISGFKSDENIQVLYPPVNIRSFWSEQPANARNLAVCTLGRFEKNKAQLDQILLAEKMPGVTFHIIGRVTTSSSLEYFKLCEKMINEKKVNNAILCPDLTKLEIIDILKKSLFFIHMMKNEHFGISCVEAIAAGCVPIVYDSGGPREIVPIKRLRFKSINDVYDILRSNLVNMRDIDALRKQMQSHILLFDEAVFSQTLEDKISELICV